jgi:sodium transport system permease protein
MLNRVGVIARKEILDASRDGRALISAALFTLMGPGMLLLTASLGKHKGPGGDHVAAGMISVFALLVPFLGGMNLAMDSLAGERERRSLLPLLLSPASRLELVLGKWAAITFFGVLGVLLNIVAYGGKLPVVATLVCLVPLSALAGAIELLVSTMCRNVKEAQTYLSFMAFVPMVIGMYLVFSQRPAEFWSLIPVAGQQIELVRALRGQPVGALTLLGLNCVTLATAAGAIALAANRLYKDDIVYGS